MKRKIGLIVGYNGEGYYGLQYNKDLHTIEKIVIEALLKAACITKINSLDPKKIDLKSSSRTDKGVHASFNLLIVKIIKEPTKKLEEELRKYLLDNGIYLYKIVKLSKRFIGHKMARSRIYKYVIPTYFLKQGLFEDDYTDLIRRDNTDFIVNDNSISCYKDNYINQLSENQNMIEKDTPEECKVNNKCLINNEEQLLTYKDSTRKAFNNENIQRAHKIFRNYSLSLVDKLKGYTSDKICIFKDILQFYIGTKNFHNFTYISVEGDVRRFIKSITVSDPIINNEIEYVEITIHGQSFLLHQIRKMMSFAVLNCKYSVNDNKIDVSSLSYNLEMAKSNFEKALSNDNVHVPKAPSQYLFLNNILFNDYNDRADEKIEISLDDKMKFEQEIIYPAIFKDENILEWFKYFDSVYFHNDKLDIFKNK